MDKHAFMRACREGGEAIEGALRALDRSFHATLHRECHRAVRDADTARDLVQETFIKVWQRCATFRGESELIPWIRSILRHAILDHLRGRTREVPMEDEEGTVREVERQVALSSEEPDDPVGRRELDLCFARCWKRFEENAPAHATALSWIVEDGLSNEQVAEILGRTPGATREFVSQCRKKARVYLAEWYALASTRGETA
jgi:RNA polymerase sigma-70 factor (ECF subfamily)